MKMTLNAFAMSEKLIATDTELARRIMRAIVKGSRYVLANKSQTVAIVAKYDKDAAPAEIAADYDAFVQAFVPTLTIASDLAARAAMINVTPDKVPPVDKAYDFSLVRSIKAELDATKWKPVP